MVGGKQVLLSLAVLSGLGVDAVCGGLLRRQHEAVESVQSATSGSSASTASEPTATVATVVTSSADFVASSPRGDVASSGLGAAIQEDISASTGEEAGVSSSSSSSSTPVRVPVTGPVPTIQMSDDTVSTDNGIEATPSATATPDTTTTTDVTAMQDSTTTPDTTTARATPTPPRGGPPKGGAPKLSTARITNIVSESMDLGYNTQTSSAETNDPSQTTFVTSTRDPNETYVSYCQASDLSTPATTWSVVHSTTITWYGDPEDYTAPYPPVSVPEETPSCIVPVCTPTGTGTETVTCDLPSTTESWNFGIQTTIANSIVFLTTDKNPAVIYSRISTPDYGVSQNPKTHDNHARPTDAADTGDVSNPVYDDSQNPPQAVTEVAQRPTPTPITVAVQPTAVVINGATIRDNLSVPTQAVIVAGQTFTINPTQVVGAGATIDRPSATGGGIDLPTPTSTSLGGVPVTVSSTLAVIGSSTFTLTDSTPTTAIISSQTFTIGPSAIAIPSQTLSLPTHPTPTEVVVAGGDLITAIGRSILVIHGTTHTYAPASTTSLLTIDDDVLTLNPSGGGITFHGSLTLCPGTGEGDKTAQYALVGGASVTRIGASVVVIKEVTYTVGPGTGTTTTWVGGELVTIAPSGVTVAGEMSLAYPFGPTTVIMPGGGVSGAGQAASATGRTGGGSGIAIGKGEDGEEDAAVGGVRPPWWFGVMVGLGVAVGIGGLV